MPDRKYLEVVFQKLRAPLLGNFLSIFILMCTCTPTHARSNGENPSSIAVTVAELFNKQPTAFYFEMDNS